MTVLNDIKRLRRMFPNDAEFGSEVAGYIARNKSCCDNLDNLYEYMDSDFGPYGHTISGIKCKVCGEFVDFKIER